MAHTPNMELARATFATLCRTLEMHDWRYEKDEETMTLTCSAKGDDLPMEFTVKIDAERMVVVMFSYMPFTIQEDKRLDAALAITAVNYALVHGTFDYNIATGDIYFRMTNSFLDSTLSEELLAYMLFCSCKTIDDYIDKFLMLSKGMISLEQFLKSLDN